MAKGMKPWTQQSINVLARQLTKVAGDVTAFSDKLLEERFESELIVDGGVSVSKGIDDTHKWLNKLIEAYDKHLRSLERGGAGVIQISQPSRRRKAVK